MSYLIFDSHGTYNQWAVVVDAQFNLPKGRTQRYSRKIIHPVTGACACVFDAGSGVQPPAGSTLVDQEYMFGNGWFQRNIGN